jgi:hypothetical protein
MMRPFFVGLKLIFAFFRAMSCIVPAAKPCYRSFLKRDSFQHGKLAWLADLDMWRFSQPPSDFAGVIFTTGYSIENDLYAGSQIEALLEEPERQRHRQLLNAICRWFAFEVQEFLAGREPQVGHRVRRVVDFSTMDIHANFRIIRGYSEPATEFVNEVLSDYQLRLRGKTLLELLVVLLSDRERKAKHGYAEVIEMCLKLYPNNPQMNRLIAEAKRQLA